MLNNKDDIDNCKRFIAKGGVKLPASYHLSQKTSLSALTLANNLSKLLNDNIDYDIAGISDLTNEINLTSGYCHSISNECDKWNQYLIIAAIPSDLIQVSIGVDIYRKLNGIKTNDEAPSILPIVDHSTIETVNTAIEKLALILPTITELMVKINIAITPQIQTPGVIAPQPLLPPNIKTSAKSLLNSLTTISTSINESNSIINKIVSTAISDRESALSSLKSAIDYTLISGNTKNTLIKSAIHEINPL